MRSERTVERRRVQQVAFIRITHTHACRRGVWSKPGSHPEPLTARTDGLDYMRVPWTIYYEIKINLKLFGSDVEFWIQV